MNARFLTAIAAVFCAAFATGANAAITIDGSVSASEYTGAQTTYIPYSPTASGDFNAVGYSSATTGYTVYYTADANNVYVGLLADPGLAAFNFANLYFDTNNVLGSDLGFEVTNKDAFIPATGTMSSASYASLGIQEAATAGTATTGDMIEIAIPWAVFTTNALGLGQPLVAPGGPLVLRSSQSFGYIVVGGTSDTYLSTRFGTVFAPEANGAVPEPASWALMLGGFGLVGSALRRRRVAGAIA
jgi:hypothetical protein